MKTVHIGLIGCGRWGRNILRDLNSLRSVVTVVDPCEQARRLALEQGAQLAVSVLEELPSVDGYIVAVPAAMHGEIIYAVLDTKKPIFVEKPLASDAETAQDIAVRAEGQVFVMHKWRYHPGIQALTNLIQTQELGEVLSLRLNRVQWGDSHRDVDSVWTLMPHDLSIVYHMLGFLPDPRYVVTEKVQSRLESMIAVLGHTPQAIVEVSSLRPRKNRLIQVLCENGVAALTDPMAEHIEIYRFGNWSPSETKPEYFSISREMPLMRELRSFINYIQGGPKPHSSASEGALIIKTISDLIEMAAT